MKEEKEGMITVAIAVMTGEAVAAETEEVAEEEGIKKSYELRAMSYEPYH